MSQHTLSRKEKERKGKEKKGKERKQKKRKGEHKGKDYACQSQFIEEPSTIPQATGLPRSIFVVTCCGRGC